MIPTVPKFARLMQWAGQHKRCDDLCNQTKGARMVIDLLGESQPCGIEPPPIISLGNGSCGVLVDDRGDALTVEETRAYAAMLLHAADECEERNK